MGAPWEKYQSDIETKPWVKYQGKIGEKPWEKYNTLQPKGNKVAPSRPRVLTAEEEALKTPLISPTDILVGGGITALGGKKLGETAFQFGKRIVGEGLDYMGWGAKSLGKAGLEKGVKAASVKNIEKLGTGFKSPVEVKIAEAVNKPVAQTTTKVLTKEQIKQPWEMTREEYAQSVDPYWDMADRPSETQGYKALDKHIEIVKKALSEGKPISPAVLKDYPALRAKPAEAPKQLLKKSEPGQQTIPEQITNLEEFKSAMVRNFKPSKYEKNYQESIDSHNKKIAMIDAEINKLKIQTPSGAKEPLPKYAGSVNLTKQDIPQEAKRIELEAAESVLPKKVQTWKQTDAKSNPIVENYNKSSEALKRVKDLKGLTVDIDAARKINAGVVGRLKEILEQTPENFDKEFYRYQEDIFKVVSEGSGEIGRALNAHKKVIGLESMGKAFAKLEKGLNPRQKEELVKLNIDNPIEVKSFLSRLQDPKFKDYFYEYWYNSILSGVPTHLVNVASNTAWSAFQVPHRALVAGVDKVVKSFTGKPREYFVKEIVPLMAGYKKSFKKGASGAWEMMKTGATRDFETKWEREVGSGAVGAFERSPHKALRKIAPYISTPTRALRAMDVWANTMAYDAQLGALATREGLKRGLKDDALKQFTEGLLKKPTKEMMDEAGEYAKYATFMDDPGKITSWIIQGREKITGARLFIPFVNTIANLTKRGIEMTPGVGLALAKGKPSQETIAKQIEGALVSLPILYKVSNGEITGRAPQEKAEREAFYRQGKLPWSIKLGDKWYSYRRVEPFNTVIASTTIAHDAIKKAKDDDEATEIFGNMVEGIAGNLIDSSYLQGVTNILDRYGGRKGMAQRTASSLVPFSSFWRSINRAYEVATEGETKVRDTKSLLGAFAQVIPGMSDKVKPKMNVWGEEIVLPGGVFRQWLPYKMSEAKDDITETNLEKLGIYPGLPSQHVTIAGKKVELPENFYRDYCILYGNYAKKYLDKTFSKSAAPRLIANKPEEMKKFIDSKLTSIRSIALNKVKLNYVKSLTPEQKRKFKQTGGQ